MEISKIDNAKAVIEHLIKKYELIKSKNKVSSYNEAQTRNELIEPLFEALGWDMRNLNSDDEVTTEESVSNGRVDLAFRINSIPVMFLEAKSMKVDLDEWRWAEQAINYSWNKSVSWAILTDFEAIKIFNSELPPTGINENLFIEIKYDEYLSRFEQLWLLSKESFENQSLSTEAEKWGKITKRKAVSEKLFEDLIEWRTLLTTNIEKNNQLINEEEIDEDVQRILDRLIFIRTAEDRKIDTISLQPFLRQKSSGKNVICKELSKLFRNYDTSYNSKLFSNHPSESIEIDDKILLSVIAGLYQTQDGFRYDFSLISADVLGSIYEEYLGNVLEKSKQKLIVTGDAKKKRKSGIYYTPQYIVKYILGETLGNVLKDAKPKEIREIKILDPASGSGSFLIEAFDFFSKKLDTIKQAELFTRFEVLRDNIYGVDLDTQAVEIAQLNLLLKTLIKKELLPSLQHNVRMGNSLLEEGDISQKPFSYKESFSEVFKNGGFDIVIGNPPYIKEFTNKAAFDGLHENKYYQGKMDIWTMFACKAIDLLKENGLLGFIAPNNWITNAGASILRNKILREGEIRTFVDFGDYKVFKNAGIQTMIIIFQKRKPRLKYNVNYAKVVDKNIVEMEVIQFLNSRLSFKSEKIVSYISVIKPKELIDNNIVFSNENAKDLLSRISMKKNFELLASEVAQGIIGNPDDAFVFTYEQQYNKHEKALLHDYFTSVGKYCAGENRGYIAYIDKSIETVDNLPIIKTQLLVYMNKLNNRREVINGKMKYFHLHWPRDKKYFDVGEKIICAIRTSEPSFFYSESEYYGSRALNIIKTDRINIKYLTGVLNSKLVFYWLKNMGKQLGDLLQVDKGPLLGIPLNISSISKQNSITKLVDELQELYKKFKDYSEETDLHRTISQEIKKKEKQIDGIVYEIYGLNEDDIGLIENYFV